MKYVIMGTNKMDVGQEESLKRSNEKLCAKCREQRKRISQLNKSNYALRESTVSMQKRIEELEELEEGIIDNIPA